MKKFYMISLLLAGVATNYVFCSEEQEERDLAMADIERNSDENTPLHYMIQSGLGDIVQFLRSHSDEEQGERDRAMANIERNSNENTPLHFAAENGHSPILQLLQNRGLDLGIHNQIEILHERVQRQNPGSNAAAAQSQQRAAQEVQVDESPVPQVNIEEFQCPICLRDKTELTFDMLRRVCQRTRMHAVCRDCYDHMVANPEGRTSNTRCPNCRAPRY